MFSFGGVLLNAEKNPSQADVLKRLEGFYSRVDNEGIEAADPSVGIYAKAAIQASNDRLNRVRRGVVIEAILNGTDPTQALNAQGLL